MTSSNEFEAVYVLDTNALVWYLKNDKKLSPLASAIFTAAEVGEVQIIISAVVLLELYYANRKHGLFPDFQAVYQDLKSRPYFRFVPLLPEDVQDFDRDSAVPEMHDRIIAGVARRLNAPLLTRDPLITGAGVCKIVW